MTAVILVGESGKTEEGTKEYTDKLSVGRHLLLNPRVASKAYKELKGSRSNTVRSLRFPQKRACDIRFQSGKLPVQQLVQEQ